MLRFIESRDGYSVYVDTTGTYVYFMHRLPAYDGWSAPLRPGFDDFTLAAEAINVEPNLDRSSRLTRFNSVMYDQYAAGEAEVCGGTDASDDFSVRNSGCGLVSHTDEMLTIDNVRYCDCCREWLSYETCTLCGEATFSTTPIGGYYSETLACNYCRDNDTSFCERCDMRYLDTDDSHEHPEMCDDECESPLTSFSIALGSAVSEASDTSRLHANEQVSVTITSDEAISPTGQNLIYSAIVEWGCYSNPAPWEAASGDFWSTIYRAYNDTEHVWKNNSGTYSRRLRSAIYKAIKAELTHRGDTEHKPFTLPEDLLARIGSIGYEHSRPLDLRVAITRDLNGSAYDFAHGDSCWWGSYSYSRCVLKSNAGFGLRSFSAPGETTMCACGCGSEVEATNSEVTGRTWVMPMRIEEERSAGFGCAWLVPTFDDDPDAYVVFNGYRALSERTGARVMSALTGLDFVGTDFNVDDDTMYVNGGSAYVVARDEVLAQINDGSLQVGNRFDRHADLPIPVTV